MMRLPALACLALLAFLPACGGGGGGPAVVVDPLRTTEEMRESCVAMTLDLVQRALDLAGPAVGLGRVDQLANLAAEAGCGLVALDATTYLLVCENVFVRGDVVSIRLDLTYTRNGVPVVSPADSDAMFLRIDIAGADVAVTGALTLVDDPDLGLTFEGALTSSSFGGCRVEAALDTVTAFPVADLPAVPRGVVFTSGRIDLDVWTPDDVALTGSAALVGRSAHVNLGLDGVFSQGQVALGPQAQAE